MVTVTPNNVITLAPELGEADPDRIALFIELARTHISEDRYSTEARARLAISLLAAHFMTMAGQEGAEQQATSESLGDLSISYDGGASGEGLLGTSYGQMYMGITQTVLVGPMLI